jgi:hypothetical protein
MPAYSSRVVLEFERFQRVGVVQALVGRLARNRQHGSIGIDSPDHFERLDSDTRRQFCVVRFSPALRQRRVLQSRKTTHYMLTGASACPLKGRTTVRHRRPETAWDAG